MYITAVTWVRTQVRGSLGPGTRVRTHGPIKGMDFIALPETIFQAALATCTIQCSIPGRNVLQRRIAFFSFQLYQIRVVNFKHFNNAEICGLSNVGHTGRAKTNLASSIDVAAHIFQNRWKVEMSQKSV